MQLKGDKNNEQRRKLVALQLRFSYNKYVLASKLCVFDVKTDSKSK